MATYIITGPNGKKYKVTGPGTKEEALARVRAQVEGSAASSDTPEMAARRRQGLDAAPPPFNPNVAGYDPQTGNVEHTSAGDKFGAFTGSVLEGVPVAGPALRSGAESVAAGLASATGGGDYSTLKRQATAATNQEIADNPRMAMTGRIAGAVAPMVAAGGTGIGARVLGMGAAPLLERTIASGASSAAISGADTYARGGDLSDILKSAAIGGGVGTVLPGAGDAIGAFGRSIYDTVAPRVRALVRPAQEAERRVGAAQTIDAANAGAPILTATDEAAAARNGQTLLNVDRGGMTTRSLLRSATNQDPEAHGMVATAIEKRLQGRGQDVNDFIDRLAGGNVSDVAAQDAISAAAKRTNNPAYKLAESTAAAQKMDDPGLLELLQAPAFRDAVRTAETRGANRAVAQGFKPIKNPFEFAADGSVSMKPGVAPTLQFWNQVKINLDGEIGKAVRAGDKPMVGDLQALKDKLVAQLDAAVPEYKAARQGAFSFFQAEDALDAGKKFVMQNRTLDETAKVLSKFTPKERQAFAIGFASELKDLVKQTGGVNVIDRVWGKAGSTQAKEKIMLALGQKNYQEFEQFVKVDAARDNLRKVMSGSDTARKLVEIGLAHISGGVGTGIGVGGSYGLFTGDWKKGIIYGAIAGLTRKYTGHVNDQMTKQIAKLLLSDDPTALQRAVTMAARNPKAAAAVEAIQTAIGSAFRGLGDTQAAPRQPLQITVHPQPSAQPNQ